MDFQHIYDIIDIIWLNHIYTLLFFNKYSELCRINWTIGYFTIKIVANLFLPPYCVFPPWILRWHHRHLLLQVFQAIRNRTPYQKNMLQRPKPATTNSENFRIKTIVLSLAPVDLSRTIQWVKLAWSTWKRSDHFFCALLDSRAYWGASLLLQSSWGLFFTRLVNKIAQSLGFNLKVVLIHIWQDGGITRTPNKGTIPT